MPKKSIFLIVSIIILSLSSCSFNLKDTQTETKYKWIYLEAQTVMKNDTTPQYLYGKVKQDFLENLDRKSKHAMFGLYDIRYVNPEGDFQIYKDGNEAGEIFFQVESIKKISVYERDPIYSFDKEDLHETALEVIQ